MKNLLGVVFILILAGLGVWLLNPGNVGLKGGLPTNQTPTATPSTQISQAERDQITQWIKTSDLNQYGDSKDTLYTGGTPLFDEATGQTIDLYTYILSKHPDRPWRNQ